MKASVVLIVALLGFAASVAWAQERKPANPATVAQPIPMLAPHLDPAKRSPALAICACVRRRDQA